ncbi:NDP-glycosyltransferase YjiC-like [Oppia nitens]|uniref:NDP-glycosyltransferase YjiC-like n=1 Tax=Oppia nitens TaxID=1686743 RepID=UPI0023DBE722|nr:NDP-glycosyltransferase YjiC-like [Oppia nitens]
MDLVINFIRCRLFIEIIECLEYLHQNIPVIIHRDIKLQNILVVLPDELVDPMNRFIRLCDFGLATVHERSLMSHTSSVGTTRYMAPEVLEGRKYNSMVDIYSLGIVGQELFGVNIYEENRDSHPIPNLIELFNRMINRMSNERPSCTEILLLANEWTITAETINNVVTNMSEIRHIFRVNNQQPVDLNILVSVMDGVGHVNACIGLAQVLQKRGHRLTFVMEKAYKGQLAEFGFDEEIIEDINDDVVVDNQIQQQQSQQQTDNPKKMGEEGAHYLLGSGLLSGLSSVDKMHIMLKMPIFDKVLEKARLDNQKYMKIVDKLNPDLIILDEFIGRPALIYSGKPWISLFSGNPLFAIDDERTPPFASGFPTNSDKSGWLEMRQLGKQVFGGQALVKYNEWLRELDLPLITDSELVVPISPYLNIYGYPEELDYTDIRPIPDNFCPVDAFRRTDPKEFKIPDKFDNRDKSQSKLIYLSMGSMGSVDVQLMKRFVDILSKTSHKYIVSKGFLSDKYDLADNMWGQASVPQTNVLPLVDLVITHGGNNSVTETFSFGKPMIVMPLFADQFDNAQRIQEKGYGIRLDPYLFKDNQLVDSIDRLLNDKQLDDRLTMASKRMLKSDSIHKACDRIENLVN